MDILHHASLCVSVVLVVLELCLSLPNAEANGNLYHTQLG